MSTIKDVRIFDGHTVIEKGYVITRGSTIHAVGEGNPPVTVGTVISKPGHTLLPGFIDAHNHSHFSYDPALRQALRFGVTTFMDMHNEYPSFTHLKKVSQEDRKNCADYKCAGVAATIEGGWPIPVITAHDKSPETLEMIDKWYPKLKTPEEAREFVRKNLKDGADYIKLMHESGAAMGASFPKPSLEIQKALIEEAHEQGVVAICHSLAMADHIEIINAGVDGMAHTFFDAPPSEELVAAYKKNGAWLNPTLATVGSLTTEGKELAKKFAHDPRVGEELLGGEERERMCQCINFAKEGSKVEYAYESVKVLKKAGIDIICGSDSAKPALGTAWGLSLHHEMYLFVEKCGMSPVEALKSATSVVARCFRFADRGEIREGLRADLVLVEGDPTKDIDATLNLRGVWREGVLAGFYEGKV
jgi:imidazolonepropionase-like amidohydrolase